MTSNRELGIDVIAIIDDAMGGLNQILSTLQEIPDQITTDININGDAGQEVTDLTTGVDDLNTTQLAIPVDTSSITGLDSDTQQIYTDIESLNNTQVAIPVDTSGITDLDSDTQQTYSDLESLGSAAEDASNNIIDSMDAADESVNNLDSDVQQTGSDTEDVGSNSGSGSGSSSGGIGDIGAAAGGIIGMATLTEAQSELYDTNISIDKIATATGIANDKMTDLVYNMTNAHFDSTDAENYIEVLHQLQVPNDLLDKNAKAMNEIQIGTGITAAQTIQYASDVKALGGNVQDLTQYYGMAQYAQDNVVGGMILSIFEEFSNIIHI
jgi:hypothetical protein